MEHFYTTNTILVKSKPAAKALGAAMGSKIFSLLLVVFFLLVSGEGFAQTGTIFIANGNGNFNWNDLDTWKIPNPSNTNQQITPSRLPGINDEVIIQGKAAVTINTTGAICKILQMDPKTGGGTPGLTIGPGGLLTATDLEILVENNGTNAKAAIAVDGTLIVKGKVTLGTGKFDFLCRTNSTVEYHGTTNIVVPQSVNSNQDVTIYGSYFNLVIRNGVASMTRDVEVEGNFSLYSGGRLHTGNNTSTGAANTLYLKGANSRITTPETNNEFILGRVQAERSMASGAINDFGNIGVTATHASGSVRSLVVTRTTGTALVFNEIVGGLPETKTSATRYFQVVNPSTQGNASTIANLNMTFDFLARERNAGEPNYGLYRGVATSGTYDLLTNISSPLNTTFSTEGALFPYFYTIAPKPSPVPLPVELVSFKAQRHAQGVHLAWATASELENSGFEVQMSTDARIFEKIGFVESKVGTTSLRQEYSFLDTKAISDTRYYRLKQIDLDGTTTYSAIRAVALGEGNGQVSTYPNPFDDMVVVKLNGTEVRNVKAVLFNAQGKAIIEQQQETAGNTITLDMSSITTKGMYILHVLDNDSKHTFKLMKR